MASKNNKSVVELIDFSKLTPHSLVVVTCESEQAPEILQQLCEPGFIPEAARGTPVLLLRPGESVKLVSEEEMNAHGWFRL